MVKKCLKNIAKTWVIIMVCMFKLIHFCLQMFLKNLGMCQSTHRYFKANNKNVKNYDKKLESSYLTYG